MPSLGLGASCCLPPMAGQGPFWCQFGVLQCFLGLRRLHFYAFIEQPCFEAPLGCLRTCWIQLSLQPELVFVFFQKLRFGNLFGYLLDPCPLPFRHQTYLRRSLSCSCRLLLRPLLPPLLPAGIRQHFLLLLGSRLLPMGRFRHRVAPICSPSTRVHSNGLFMVACS